MSALSNLTEEDILDYILNGNATTITYDGDVHIALFGTTASLANLEAGTLTGEVSGGSYARVQMDSTISDKWTIANPAGTAKNTAAVTFPTATASWGVVRYVAVMDAATTGNVICYGQLTADKTVDDGDTLSFAIDELVLTLA